MQYDKIELIQRYAVNILFLFGVETYVRYNIRDEKRKQKEKDNVHIQ